MIKRNQNYDFYTIIILHVTFGDDIFILTREEKRQDL